MNMTLLNVPGDAVPQTPWDFSLRPEKSRERLIVRSRLRLFPVRTALELRPRRALSSVRPSKTYLQLANPASL